MIKNEIDSYMFSPMRKPVCAGSSYSESPDLLSIEMKEIIEANFNANKNYPPAKALIVPHIDFRIGPEAHLAYSAAYNSILNSDADLFVIFGTAHYGNSSYFMLTEKDFLTPFGKIETDKEIINTLKNKLGDKIVFDELTHRTEHSIELQTILLHYIFRNRNFKILPILVGSFHQFIYENRLPSTSKIFNDFTDSLKQAISESNRKVIYIASADFAHIGRKFGDSFDAEIALEILKDEDIELIDSLVNVNEDNFFQKITNSNDKRRICGLSPIYTMLKTADFKYSKLLEYQQWNEIETKSAVSFATIAYY